MSGQFSTVSRWSASGDCGRYAAMIGFVQNMSDKFDKLLEEMSRLGIGNRDELKGCTSRQIQRLENKLGVTIPESYRRYLQLMGQDSARLFAHDRIHVKYADVLDLTVDATAFLADWSNDKPTNPNNCSLPSDALVILYRDSCDDYNFIRCNRATDSSFGTSIKKSGHRRRFFDLSTLG